ncbi:hypothetical protein QUF50_07040 [Thiotrichales bacterium HSG1]|nr:hypothetical protein [Thiotrichales bacterium HSG1]
MFIEYKKVYNNAMNKYELELYTDYLMVTFGYATSTGLSNLLDEDISHDTFTRFLSKEEYDSKELWKHVKPLVREIRRRSVLMIRFKTHMKENELICWHYDHTKGRSVKGINLLNCLYNVDNISIPVSFELIHKPIKFTDPKTSKEKRRNETTKNELMRSMINTYVQT